MRRTSPQVGSARLLSVPVAAALSTLLAGSLVAPAQAAPPSPAAQSPSADQPPQVAQAPPGVTVTSHHIEGSGGVQLDAKVIEPAGEGPFPVLVLPASWSLPSIEYVGAAADMAYNSGYIVVSYTTRGFYTSGGEIEVAGHKDTADASKVIDWALENTQADPARIGMAGISYGAGISALTAAADPRVRAISAMSGWADLEASLYPGRTVSTQAAEMLLGAGHITGRFGPELRELERAYRAGDVEPALGMAPARSPLTKVDQLNANGTAVMIANAWQDSLFQPQQMADLYQGLTGPKRLMLSPGDHATPELFGAAGLPNEIWASTKRWFDHHLRGVENGIEAENPVQLKPLTDGPWRGYPDWESVAGTTDTRYLGEPRQDHPLGPDTGSLAADSGSDWSREVHAGTPTAADSGVVMISGILQSFGLPAAAPIPLVDRRASGVWATDPYPTAVTVSGAPMLRTTVVPTAGETSLFAYLYDVDQAGNGRLVTHEPVTLRDAEPWQPQQLDLALEPARWNVPAGHRLALVVDTVDPRYESADRSTVFFDSSAESPSRLDIPLG